MIGLVFERVFVCQMMKTKLFCQLDDDEHVQMLTTCMMGLRNEEGVLLEKVGAVQRTFEALVGGITM